MNAPTTKESEPVRGALLNCGRAEKKEGRRKRVRFLFCCGWKRGMRGEEGKYIYIYIQREREREKGWEEGWAVRVLFLPAAGSDTEVGRCCCCSFPSVLNILLVRRPTNFLMFRQSEGKFYNFEKMFYGRVGSCTEERERPEHCRVERRVRGGPARVLYAHVPRRCCQCSL